MIVTEEEAKKLWCPMLDEVLCGGTKCMAFTYRGERLAGNELRAVQNGPKTEVQSFSIHEKVYSCGMAPGGKLEEMEDYE